MLKTVTIPFEYTNVNHTDITVKCPYCDNETPIKQWNFDVQLNCLVKNNKLEIDYIVWGVQCPTCETFITIRETERVPADNMIELKRVIESYDVGAHNKKAKCPSCGWWNSFYGWRLRGFAEYLDVRISSKGELSVDYHKPQKIFITKVICANCNCKFDIDRMEAYVPMSDDEVIMLINKIREISSNT